MATREQIEAKDTNPLNSLERELVRQILNVNGKAGSATYVESEARMLNLVGSQNQIIRALLDDYSDISFDTLSVIGGQKGANYSPQRDKEAIAGELRRMLYPSSMHDDPTVTVVVPIGTVQHVPICYAVGSQDEFS